MLEGHVRMVDADKNETLIQQDESFLIRNTIRTSWKQEGFLRKFFMTYASPNSPVAGITSADGGVMVLDPVTRE